MGQLQRPHQAATLRPDALPNPSIPNFLGHRQRIVAIGAEMIRSVGIGCMGSLDVVPFASCTKGLSSRKLAKTESVARRITQHLCDSCLEASDFVFDLYSSRRIAQQLCDSSTCWSMRRCLWT